MTVVCWFRRDLRLRDNPALAWAAGEGLVVPLFVDDPAFDDAGAPRRQFLRRSLEALGAATDGALIVRRGDPRQVVPAVAEEANASVVVAAADFGPYGRERDSDVDRALSGADRELRFVGSPCAVEPGNVTKADGDPYSVFTPFSKVWRSIGWDAPIDAPDVRWRRLDSDGLPEAPEVDAELPPVGEDAALARWSEFCDVALDRYDEIRNQPGVDGTSRMSTYLRWGVVHPRQLLAELGSSKAHDTFRSELAWREFYADVLFHRPQTAWSNLQSKMDAMPIDTDRDAKERFAVWCRGETGYPIVDAGIRQLLATGWVHNRVRMILASFLVKDLHLPWWWGARFFMQHLVDGDLASNNHGWQWTAGTGTDAAPYFRIFNPIGQSKKFDPDGTYLRTWVHELAHLGEQDIHAPWESKRGVPLGYHAPMVDHAEEARGSAIAAMSRSRAVNLEPY
ncbi:MAG: deoxyribodipyrimidine photo-lyase [Ilumatobacteraceae bacterium]